MIFVTSSFKPLKPKFFFYSSWVAKYVTRERKLFLSSKYHLLYVISYHPMNLIRENTSKRPFFEMEILSLAFFLFITSSNKKTTLTSCKHYEMCSGTLKVFYIMYLSGNKFHVLQIYCVSLIVIINSMFSAFKMVCFIYTQP